VHVCPTGVDIRNGPNLGCIQCGLCIDACDAVMAKIGRPPRLIAYDTDLNIKLRQEGKPSVFNIVRMRTVLYAAIIAFVGGLMLYTLATRHDEAISVIHDRNPIFVRLSDGAIRNAYTVRVVNKRLEARDFALSVTGLSGAVLDIVGQPPRSDAQPIFDVGPDQTRELRVLVTHHGRVPPSTDITFVITDVRTGIHARERDHFRGP
jgi:polyferredoxin